MSVGAVNCSGMEAGLFECALVVLPVSCVSVGVAGVVCQGMWIHVIYFIHIMDLFSTAEPSIVSGNCTNGQVRLVGGENVTLGRVEVCINNAWGTVCNSRFGTNEAKVICNQLDFSNTGI